MCCLRYEYDAYKDFKQRAPKKGTKVEFPDGEGKVQSFNTPREIISVRMNEGGTIKVPLEAMECPGGGCPCKVSAEALEATKVKEIETGVSGPVRELTESAPMSPSVSGEGAPERRERKESEPRKDGGEGSKKKEGSGSGRSRRRRKPRGGSSKGAQGSESAQAESGAGQPKAAASTEGDAAAGKQPGGSGSGRRRRRRRSSGPKTGDNAGE